MSKQLKVVFASNRGPISFSADDAGFAIKRGAGGLAGALDPVARQLGKDASWIAAANSQADRDALHSGQLQSMPDELGYELRLLDVDPETYSLYYDEVSNGMLWFANHCLWDEIELEPSGDRAAWSAYEEVNERFADEITAVSDADWFVLFQDYHLATAPKYLREKRGPDQIMFHFTHSSFCGPGLLRLPDPIPRRVLEGMVACDLVGFHTKRWASSFLDCCEGIGAAVDRDAGRVRFGEHSTWVRTYPIPIDARDLSERASGDAARTWADRFLEDGTQTLLVRADRTEPSKNIVRGFLAFGSLLDRRSDLAGRTKFIACLYPSRQSMPEYQRYLERIKGAAAEVNGRHPGSIELFLEDDFDRTLGALKVYDALLVNSLMDGMNLVSKEGPALNERDGVVILSSGAGSFEELGALSVAISEPKDLDATEKAIEAALDLDPDLRQEMAAALKKVATEARPEDWIAAQIQDLESLRDSGEPVRPY